MSWANLYRQVYGSDNANQSYGGSSELILEAVPYASELFLYPNGLMPNAAVMEFSVERLPLLSSTFSPF